MTTTVMHIKDAGSDAVYIGRRNRTHNLPTSKWANPYVVGKDGSRDEVIARFLAYLLASPDLMTALPELCGKRLACWCYPKPCHGDVLAELADHLSPTMQDGGLR